MSDRVQRQVARLLDDVEEAVESDDWATVLEKSRSVLLLDPGNSDGQRYLAAAGRVLGRPASVQDHSGESQHGLASGILPTADAEPDTSGTTVQVPATSGWESLKRPHPAEANAEASGPPALFRRRLVQVAGSVLLLSVAGVAIVLISGRSNVSPPRGALGNGDAFVALGIGYGLFVLSTGLPLFLLARRAGLKRAPVAFVPYLHLSVIAALGTWSALLVLLFFAPFAVWFSADATAGPSIFGLLSWVVYGILWANVTDELLGRGRIGCLAAIPLVSIVVPWLVWFMAREDDN